MEVAEEVVVGGSVGELEVSVEEGEEEGGEEEEGVEEEVEVEGVEEALSSTGGVGAGSLSVLSHITNKGIHIEAIRAVIIIKDEENQSLSLPLSIINCKQPNPTKRRIIPT